MTVSEAADVATAARVALRHAARACGPPPTAVYSCSHHHVWALCWGTEQPGCWTRLFPAAAAGCKAAEDDEAATSPRLPAPPAAQCPVVKCETAVSV